MVPSSLNCLSTIVVKAEMITGDTLWNLLWPLAMKSEERKRANFPH